MFANNSSTPLLFKNIYTFIVLLFLVFTNTFYIYAHDCSEYLLPRFQNLTLKDGLSNLAIHSICQDDFGYIWIGTARGLNRYDGTSFKHYFYNNDNPSISHNDIIELHKAPNGNIICRTNSGTNIYDIKKEKLVSPLTSLSDHRFFLNHNSILYSTFRAKGLYKHSNDLQKTEKLLNFPDNLLISKLISEDKTGIWVLTFDNKYLINYNLITFKHKKYTIPDFGVASSEGNIAIIKNYVLISSKNEIKVFNIKTRSFENLNENFSSLSALHNKTINFISEVENNVFWIGTKSNGLYAFNYTQQTLQNIRRTEDTNSLNSNHLTCVFKDKTNNIWLGTFDRGLEVTFDGCKNFNFDLALNSITKNKFISAICTNDKSNIYLGTKYNGALVYNSQTKKTSVLNADNSFLKNNNIRSLFISSKNDLWISTEENLHILNLDSKKHRTIEIPKPNNGLTSFLESENNVFAGSDKQGLLVFSLKGELLDTITTFNTNVRQTVKQKDGKLVVAAYSRGCFIYDYKNNSKVNLSDLINKPVNLMQIATIFIDSNENLWIGNFKYGLYQVSKNKKEVKVYSSKDGLPCNDITGIIEDNFGNIWISTAYGLSMLNDKNKFINYSYNEGLNNIQFHQKAATKDKFGTLYFGGNLGLTFFNPSSFKLENKDIPDIILESLKVSNQLVIPNDETQILEQNLALTSNITLTHEYPSFSIEYQGFDFVAAQNLKYAYILEGSDKNWNYVNTRTFASYQNLKPGDYIFKVKAQNNNGIWSENPATLKITIKPAPWLTIWAMVAYLIVLSLLIVISFKIVLNIKQYKKELVFEHDERLRENEIAQMKMRFFTNISHEIRTPVTLIKGNVDFLISELREKNMTLKSIGSLKNSTDRLLKLINQLLSFRQLENDALDLEVKNEDIIKITKELTFSFLHTAKLKNISISVETEKDSLVIPLDFDKYEKILNNLLSNSLKFSKPDGVIKIIIEEKTTKELSNDFNIHNNANSFVQVTVFDNGKGISESELPHIFNRYTQYSKHNKRPDYSSTGIGLNFTKRLVELHKGSICAESTEGVETKFSFIIPTDTSLYNTTPKTADSKASEKEGVFVEEEEKNDVGHKETVILVAEDDIELNDLISNALSGRYKVISTYDGNEAFKVARKELPDIVISDIMMPELDGIGLCKKIREDKLISHLPIVLLTAKTDVENKIIGLNNGADDYISKPFELSILKARIQNLINQRKALQEYYKQSIPVEYRSDQVNQQEINFMKKINSVIEENYSMSDFNVNLLAEKMNMSRTSFYRKFMSIANTPPKDYITCFRINKSIDLIHSGLESLGEISYLCGFSSQTIFSNSFRKIKGILPLQYKKILKEKPEV